MSKLADNIRQAALEKSPENLPTGTNTEDLQTQLAVGATGKAQAAGQNLKQSNIAEQIGMVNARVAQTEVVEQGMEAAQEMANKEAAAEVQAQQVAASNRTKEIEQQAFRQDQMDQIMSQIRFSEKDLEAREDRFQLEQVAANLRLGDEKYRHDLNMIASTNRIDNGARIREEATRLAMGEASARLYQDLANQYQLGEISREESYKKDVMSAEHAFKVAEAALEDYTTASMISLAKDVAVTGVSAYQAGLFDTATTTAAPTAVEEAAGMSMESEHTFGVADATQNQSTNIPAPWET